MVGTKIRDYIKANGLKFSFVAEKVGIDRTKLYNICNGRCSVDALSYYKICKVLNVPFETFLEE